MTHKKIAYLAGVSPSTVSKALSDNKEISLETIQKVKRIAEECGYYKEKKERKKENEKFFHPTVAVLCPEINSVTYASSATMIRNAVKEINGITTIYISDFDTNEEANRIKEMKEQYIDGIISFSTVAYDKKSNIPIVYLGNIEKNSRFDSVYNNIYGGIEQAILHLKNLGHRDIGFIGELNTKEQFALFKRIMAKNDLVADEKFIYIMEKRFEQIGYEAVQKMLLTQNIPTAFLCAYDEVALGTIHALKLNGFRVPSDISIIGMNDIPYAAYAEVPLTTIRTHMEEQCRLAVKILTHKMKNNNSTMIQNIEVQCELIERKTTGKVKENF